MKRNWALLPLLSFCASLICGPSTCGQTFVRGNTSVYGAVEPFWLADFNGDGKLDLLDGPTLFANTGGVNDQWFAAYPTPPLAWDFRFSEAWRDENGDGLLDFVAATYNDVGQFVIDLYLQSADHQFTAVPLNIPGTPICWADLDNDGRLDIVTLLSTPPYGSHIYWGAGDRKFVADPRNFDTYSVQAADLDGDGDLDLLFRGYGMHAYRNDGGRVFTDMGVIAPSSASSGGRLIDLDGDGRLDVLGDTAIFIAQGDFQMTSNHIGFGNTYQYAILDAADLDGDGIPELMLGGYFDTAAPAVFLGRTNDAYVQLPYTYTGTGQYYGARFADFDGDGDIDYMATPGGANRLYLNQTGVKSQPAVPIGAAVRVTRDRVFFSWANGAEKSVTYNLRIGSRPGAGDLMDSGSLPSGQRLLAQMGNAQTSTRWHLDGLKPGVYYWTVQAVDWGYRGSAFLPEMSFTVTGTEDVEPIPTISITTTNLVTDEDTPAQMSVFFGPESLANSLALTMRGGDSSLAQIDLVGSGANWTLKVQPVTNRFGSTSVVIRAVSLSGEASEVVVGITVRPVNDVPTIGPLTNTAAYAGDPPLFISLRVSDVESDSNSPTSTLRLSAKSSDERILPSAAISVSRSTMVIGLVSAVEGSTVVTLTADDGEASVSRSFTLDILPPPFRLTRGPGSFLNYDFKLADFDNDGFIDYVDAKAVHLNKPVGWGEVFWMWQEGDTRIAVADFDGDNFVDILMVSSASVRFLHNQTGTNFEARAVEEIHACTPMQIETADLDNDGDVDVIVVGKDGAGVLKTWVYLNTGSGFVERKTDLPGFTAGYFALTDLDRDGWMDFVFNGFDERGVGTNGIFFGASNGRFNRDTDATAVVPRWFRGFADVNSDGIAEAWAAAPFQIPIQIYKWVDERFSPAASFSNGPAGQGGWVDVNNDGLLDLVGGVGRPLPAAFVLNRDGYQFISMPDPFRASSFDNGRIAFADIDNDGAIDIVTTNAIWINQTVAPNFTPTTPTNLRAVQTNDSITLRWDGALDFNQRGGLTYNVRIGTRPGGSDVLSAASLPSGKRLLPQPGNAGTRTTITITNLTGETYYWSVQAVDDVFAASAFAEEHTLVIEGPGNLPPVISISPLVPTAAEDAPGTLRVTVEDDRTYPELISVEVSSLTPDLISTSGIHVESDGGKIRNVTFIPVTNAFGSGSLQIRATDAVGAVSALTIPVAITPVDDAPVVTKILGQKIESPFDPITVELIVSDVDDALESLRFLARSDNQGLIRDDEIRFGWNGTNRTVELKAASLTNMGVAQITVTVADPSGATATNYFAVTVTNSMFMADVFEPVDRWARSLGLADVNNDGWLDIAVSSFNTLVYTNGPSGLARVPGVYPFAQSVDFGDYDRDGSVDLLLHGVASAAGYPLGGIPWSIGDPGVYKNDGTGSFAIFATNITRLFEGPGQFVDLNNDGALDLVLTGTTNEQTVRAELYLNTITDLAPIRRISSVIGQAPMIEDFDGDGLVDLHVRRLLPPENLVWEEKILYQRNGAFVERPMPWPGQLLAWNDFNNDGLPDALILTTNSDIQLFLQSSSGFTAVSPPIAVAYVSIPQLIAQGDFDGDGLNDLILATSGAQFFKNLGGGQFRAIARLVGGASGVADVNNDGRLDMVSGSHVYRNTAVATNTPPEAPRHVWARNTTEGLMIEWDLSKDANQSGGLTYNVAVGTAPGKWDIMNPMSAANGWRKIPRKGNAGWRRSKLVKGLETGRRVYFTVQAVDNSFAGSPFAAEQSIEVITPPSLTISMGSNDSISFSVTGLAGGVYQIQMSRDLQNWIELWQWEASSGESNFTVPSSGGNLFFRAVGQ